MSAALTTLETLPETLIELEAIKQAAQDFFRTIDQKQIVIIAKVDPSLHHSLCRHWSNDKECEGCKKEEDILLDLINLKQLVP